MTKEEAETLPGTTGQTMNEETKKCANCCWYVEFEGVCCNGDCPERADFVDEEYSDCAYWERDTKK